MSELSPVERLILLREAGNVERSHTLPHHGSYSVGKHSFDAALILLVCHPDPSMELLKAVLMHDLGERYTGDVPSPTKWSDGEIARRLDRLESRALEAMGITIQLSPEDHQWLMGVDRVEFLLWCKDQIAMGNMGAATVLGAQLGVVADMDLPDELRQFVAEHMWTRTPDVLPK